MKIFVIWPLVALSLAVAHLNTMKCNSTAIRKEWYVLFLISLDLQLGVHVTSPHQVQFIVLSAERVYTQRAVHDFQATLTQPGQVSRGTKSDG